MRSRSSATWNSNTGASSAEPSLKAKQPKTDRDRLASKKVFSAAGGLDKLTGAMAEAIGPARITLSAADVTVRPCADKWMVTYSTADGEQTIIAERIITTTRCLYIARPVAFRPERKDGADQ